MRQRERTGANGVFVMLLALCLVAAAGFAFLAVPSLTASQGSAAWYSSLLWFSFALCLAAVAPLSMLTFRRQLVGGLPDIAGVRFARLSLMVYLAVLFWVAPFPLWYFGRPFDVPGGILFVPWPRLAYHLMAAVVPVLLFRYVMVPITWEFLRFMVPPGGEDQFLGSRIDRLFRPEYYDQDLKWLFRQWFRRSSEGAAHSGSGRLPILTPLIVLAGSCVLMGALIMLAPEQPAGSLVEPGSRAMAPHEFVEPEVPVPNDDMREREVADRVEKVATTGFEALGTTIDELDPEWGPYRLGRFEVNQNVVIVNTLLENTSEGRSTAGRIAEVIRAQLVDNHWGVDTLHVVAADGTVIKAVEFTSLPR